ncbi:MAG: hypothetical protein MK208_17115 [Shimia sp.]|uniref:hypothetical protein n=1 Tax=Shimia sp. TaxID=1954381 RepID=UPI0025F78A68|nr:hypothetical protein [Shimia sp.]MCH2068960.1 hypothetical protein [Shimia sp.]
MQFACPAALLGLTLLTACATPLERCISTAQSEVATLRRAITTAEDNITLGYAIHRSSESYTYYDTCYDKKDRPYSCPETRYRTVETPVEIDVAQQRQRLKALRRDLPAAEDRARMQAQHCTALHPPTG